MQDVRSAFSLIPILGFLIIGLAAVLLVIAWGIRSAGRTRELEHAERMKALEVGGAFPGDEPWWSPARIAVAIGVVVPLGVFLGTMGAIGSGGVPPDPVLWITTGLIATAGVIGGTILAARLPKPDRHPEAGRPTDKRAFDPEAYDVVGRRG